MLQVAVKVDLLRRPSAIWEAMQSQYPDLPLKLQAAGLDDVEHSFDVSGDRQEDSAALEALCTAAGRWHASGMNVHIHPYCKRAANPAAFLGPDHQACEDSLKRVLDTAATLADACGRPVAVVYHAAELTQAEAGRDPRHIRQQLLEASVAFFHIGWEYASQFGNRVYLVSETQCPTNPADARVRIADTPDEMAAIIGSRHEGVCMDTGHYILSVGQFGATEHPAWLHAVNHMHLHDVAGDKDHRPIGPHSSRVARYVHLAALAGLRSATLEYDLAKVPPAGANGPDSVLQHLAAAVSLVRQWATGMEAAEEIG